MTLIRVIPEILKTTSGKMSHVNGDIGTALNDLSSVLSGIGNDYNGQLRNQVASKVGQAQGTASGPRNHLNDLTLELDKRAKLFEAADGASSEAFTVIGDPFFDPRQASLLDRLAWLINMLPILDWWRLGLVFLPPAWLLLVMNPPNSNTSIVPPWLARILPFPFPDPRDWPPYLKYILLVGGPNPAILPIPFLVPGIVSILPIFRALPFPPQLPTFPGIRLPWNSKPAIVSPLSDGNVSKSKEPQAHFPTEQVTPKTQPPILTEKKPLVQIKDPGMKSPWGQIDAPNKNEMGDRSPDAYRNVIDQFDVEHSYPLRYRPNDSLPDTRCNIFAGDVMKAMGAPLPTKGELGHGAAGSETTDRMTANATDQYNWLSKEQDGWRRIDPKNASDLQLLLDHLHAGKPALASDPEHIAVLRPDQPSINDYHDLHVAQAGWKNWNDNGLFGIDYNNPIVFHPDIFIHD